jgi:hypothetical protein
MMWDMRDLPTASAASFFPAKNAHFDRRALLQTGRPGLPALSS